MTIDTPVPLEIAQSPWRMLGIGVLGVIMTAGSGAIALHAVPNVPRGSLPEFIGYVGLVFFGLCTVIGLWRTVTARGPVLTLSVEGIRDTRVAAEAIPWAAVRGISTWEQSGQKVMVLAIDPETESRLTLTRIARWSRGPNRALGADGLAIATTGLAIGYDTLLQTSLRYAEAARQLGRAQ